MCFAWEELIKFCWRDKKRAILRRGSEAVNTSPWPQILYAHNLSASSCIHFSVAAHCLSLAENFKPGSIWISWSQVQRTSTITSGIAIWLKGLSWSPLCMDSVSRGGNSQLRIDCKKELCVPGCKFHRAGLSCKSLCDSVYWFHW